jgi:hypothetical protein
VHEARHCAVLACYPPQCPVEECCSLELEPASWTLGYSREISAYAVLAHEAIIDSLWDTNIRPLLVERFPSATLEEIKEAHGYAYGGAIIQDIGYYPHGSFFFSDLAHYVRSGDFVVALLRDSKDIDGATHSRVTGYPEGIHLDVQRPTEDLTRMVPEPCL